MPPISMLIKPASSACNMRCKYCFYEDEASCREQGFRGLMTKETAENIIKTAVEAAEGSVSFMFQGGEPTLAGLEFYKNFLETEKKYKKENIKFYHSIQTNGFALDEEWVEFFKENSFFVGLSLDGNSDLHDLNRLSKQGSGTHSKVLKAAKLLEKYGVEFNILSVVTAKAARTVEKNYNFFKKQGFDSLQFIDCLDSFDGNTAFSADNNEYFTFLDRLFALWLNDLKAGRYVHIRQFDNWFNILLGGAPEACNMCGHCTVQFVVEADGSVYPCDFYALDEYKIGTVGKNTLKEMFECETAQQFLRASMSVPDDCKNCRWFAVCRNGCRRERELLPDLSYVKYRRCEAVKAFFDKNEQEIAKSLRLIGFYQSKAK
ncbi:MAG: anaerobic sulfatase maturase [Clostridia bacterium]|nr:anaerobic sulfatase maturase [Clostridia bacterium]